MVIFLERRDINELKRILSRHFKNSRTELDITQAKMAEVLHISPRSYSDLEHGKTLCRTYVLLFFLLYSGDDILALLLEIKTAFEQLEN